jgi:electron transfer flavoprotein beta subunit
MDIVVLIKQVPDTASRIQDRVKDGAIDLEGVTWIVSPYDEYAVEEALRIKEAKGGTVTLLSVGPERSASALKDMLALGADEAIHIQDAAFEGLGPRALAAVLAAAIGKLPQAPDMVWAGWMAADQDQGLLPIYLASALDMPHVSFVTSIEVGEGSATARREIEGGKEVVEVDLPAVFSAQKGLNEVRYASLKGIMAVKRKQIPVWDAAELGIDVAALGSGGLTDVNISTPPERGAGRIIEGEPEDAARELVRLLHEEAKVI